MARKRTAPRVITPETARRLAITCQRLSGERPAADQDGILEVVRQLRCLQIDPISVVARTQYLVLFSRIGPYDKTDLEALLWEEKSLFEQWAHAASVVLAEDYPIHSYWMRNRGTDLRPWTKPYEAIFETKKPLRRRILAELRKYGPLPSRHFLAEGGPSIAGVSAKYHLRIVMDALWLSGKIMVAGRPSTGRVWDLAERCLPKWTPRERLTPLTVTRRSVELALHALGVARPEQIKEHFVRRGYPKLERVLAEGPIERVAVGDLRGEWYIHAAEMELLDRIEAGEFEPRTSLLSPFDNLICDRKRTRQLFDFDFTLEIYKPKAKRKDGYYVLPILHGDRFVGRADLAMDRKAGVLDVIALRAEPGTPKTKALPRAVGGALGELAIFLGATGIRLGRRIPAGWRTYLAQ